MISDYFSLISCSIHTISLISDKPAGSLKTGSSCTSPSPLANSII